MPQSNNVCKKRSLPNNFSFYLFVVVHTRQTQFGQSSGQEQSEAKVFVMAWSKYSKDKSMRENLMLQFN